MAKSIVSLTVPGMRVASFPMRAGQTCTSCFERRGTARIHISIPGNGLPSMCTGSARPLPASRRGKFDSYSSRCSVVASAIALQMVMPRSSVRGSRETASISSASAAALTRCGALRTSSNSSAFPLQEPGAPSISLDPVRLRQVCRRAVRILYRFGLTVPDSDARRQNVEKFRAAYGSGSAPKLAQRPISSGCGIRWPQWVGGGGSTIATTCISHARFASPGMRWPSTNTGRISRG